MSEFIFVSFKPDWLAWFKKNPFGIFFAIFIPFLVFFAFNFINELPVWYFRATTFSWDDAVTLQTRQAACARLQAPAGRTRVDEFPTLFPESFYRDKHFFEVFYSPVLKQCIYEGVDIFHPISSSSTISFYIASPYLKHCIISRSSGFCVGVAGKFGKYQYDPYVKYRTNFFLPEIATPLPVPAPLLGDHNITQFTFSYEATTSPNGLPKKVDPGWRDWHRFGATGDYNRFQEVYDKYFKVVEKYLKR